MRTNKQGIELIKFYEGCPMKNGLCVPYLCSAGYPTIGYGSRFINGVEVTLKTKPITVAQAETIFLDWIVTVEKEIAGIVKVKLTDNQFSALTSFVYNLGIARLKTSTLLKKINANDFTGAAQEFLKWNKETINGVLKENTGLSKRRLAEQKLFMQ